MLKTIDVSAKTTDEAIEKALSQLGLSRDEVSVEIVERGRSGFLGIGATAAVVRVSYDSPDEAPQAPRTRTPEAAARAPRPPRVPKAPRAPEAPKAEKPAAPRAEKPTAPRAPRAEGSQAEQAEAFLKGLLERMGVEAELQIAPREGGGLDINLAGEDIGAVIGRRGETLDAIQHLTNYAVNRGSDKRAHINVDAENYRAKREDSLVRLAQKMAARVIKYRRSLALEPMNSYERHIIHTALQDVEGVSTSSTGTEPNRRVVVSFVRSDKTERTERPRDERPARTQRPAFTPDAPEKTQEPTEPVQPVTPAAPAVPETLVQHPVPAQAQEPAAPDPNYKEWC